MYHCAVIYAPAEGEINKIADAVRESMQMCKFSVAVKEAAGASIPDMAAADLILLGSSPQGEGEASIHSDFSEIIRALEGVNLAGRVAGVFAVDSEKTLTDFRKALKDSEITLKNENLILIKSNKIDKNKIKKWLNRLSAQVEERVDG